MALAQTQTKDFWTVEEYLEFEKDSPIRHEYVDGQLYAMAGGTKNHNRIARRVCNLLEDRLPDERCEPFIADVKVKVRPSLYYYPDVVVSCEPLLMAVNEQGENEYIAEHPALIVEVLSKGTERTDRNEKMQEYKSLPSLREYVLIAQERVRVEVYSHDRAGADWRKETYEDLQTEVAFASIGVTVKLAEIYRRVKFPEQNEQEEGELQ